MKNLLIFLPLLATVLCAEESTSLTRPAYADLQASDRHFLAQIESAPRRAAAEPTVILGHSSGPAQNRAAPRKAVVRSERTGEEASGASRNARVTYRESRPSPAEDSVFLRVSSEPRVTFSITPWWIIPGTTTRTTFRIRSAVTAVE